MPQTKFFEIEKKLNSSSDEINSKWNRSNRFFIIATANKRAVCPRLSVYLTVSLIPTFCLLYKQIAIKLRKCKRPVNCQIIDEIEQKKTDGCDNSNKFNLCSLIRPPQVTEIFSYLAELFLMREKMEWKRMEILSKFYQ